MLENTENRICGCGCDNPSNNFDIENYQVTTTIVESNSCPNTCNSCEDKENARREMMMKIRELDFAIIELGLYLDTHPDDQKALCLHREYCREVKDLKDKYQKVYGPLTIFYPCNKWRWLEEPWPWERGNF